MARRGPRTSKALVPSWFFLLFSVINSVLVLLADETADDHQATRLLQRLALWFMIPSIYFYLGVACGAFGLLMWFPAAFPFKPAIKLLGVALDSIGQSSLLPLFVDTGWDDLSALAGLQEHHVAQIAKLKPGHIARFRRCLRRQLEGRVDAKKVPISGQRTRRALYRHNRSVQPRRMSSASSSGSSSAEVDAGSVVTATECAWEQVTDGESCFVEPRSCYDCLNTPLSNGQECVLTPYGLCESISAYNYSEDYRRAQSAFTYPIHYNYFPEVNTTYCEPNDSVCNSCQETTFTIGNKNPSVYCTGTADCVCVAVCEAESWWNDTLARLETYLEENNETTTCPLAANSSSTSASDASASSNLTTPGIKDAYAADDECMWYQNSTLCETPRTCYDCLNTALYSGQKCTITPGGYCTKVNEYDYTLDYRRVFSDSAAHYFPSTNTTYCEYDDATCTECRSDKFVGAFAGNTNLSAFCTGEDDCVCVAFCESPNWKAIVTEEACEATPTRGSSGGSSISSIGIASIVVVAVLLALSALLQLLNMFRARRREVRWHNMLAQSIAVRRQPTTGLSLELSAWKEVRNGLIANERNVSSEDFLGHRLADAPIDAPMVTVEEGDGYRPMSPSVPVLPASPPSPARPTTILSRSSI